ncbi:hypothetical protein J7E83_14450 [Arthrobacter sp. ISL-48]|uniref:hypothetical protein n=1 Tax=Arthrobacter sp. ISL-48 TaxID=2819110 RepID=UPI001BE511D1|nr:hypothetical protein [Arthrobacter sp. ISL-48]MBT2533297.1 hypothetical protein [Arthrobacter sp. ISL-48]
MDTQSIFTFVGGYVATAVTVFLLYSPVLFLFVLLLLVGGVLQLMAWPFIVLIRRLRRPGKFDGESDSSWLLH